MRQQNIEEAREHLAELRQVFIARYRLTEPYDSPGIVAIDAAIEAGADADISGLRVLIEEYNLYGHRALAQTALAGAEAALSREPPAVVHVPPDKPLERQNKAELFATAAARGIDVPEGATNAELREALSPVGFQEEPAEEQLETPEDEPEEGATD